MPSTSAVLLKVANVPQVKFLVGRSKFKSEEGKKLLFSEELWKRVDCKVLAALKTCAATCEKDIEDMQKMYQDETHEIIMSFAPHLHEHFPSQQIMTSEEDIIDASLLLQYISMKYILVLHNNISYLHGGWPLSSYRWK